jgi:23S rRNA pseudouridine1911/1915/1917 synthase
MAMNPTARQRLIDQLQTRTMKREYVAYVEGRPSQPKGTWRNWLKLRDDELRQYVISDAEAKVAGDKATEAITHYEVITEFKTAGSKGVVTKLRLRLETGRKHQIRAQAAHAGLPLLGDRTYHPKYHGDAPRTSRIDFPRQALHAETLSLEHPEKIGTRVTWTAALPKDMQELERSLRSGGR